MLFSDYKTTPPESLPRIMLHRDHFFPIERETVAVGRLYPPKVVMERLAKHLTDDEAEKVNEFAAALMLLKSHRRKHAKEILEDVGLAHLFIPDFAEEHEEWLEEHANEPLGAADGSDREQPSKKRSKRQKN
jgi:hypothetical protein